MREDIKDVLAESSVKLHRKEKQICQHKDKKNQYKYGDAERMFVRYSEKPQNNHLCLFSTQKTSLHILYFVPSYNGWFITSQHAKENS